MIDNATLVAQANALIKRRRSFLATPPPPSPPAAEAPLDFDLADSLAPLGDDDLPVLTEVVNLNSKASAEEANPSIQPAALEEHPDLQESLVSILAADLAHTIEQRLATELPGLIEATLTGLQEALKHGIAATTEAALQDFVTRRQPSALSREEAEQAAKRQG